MSLKNNPFYILKISCSAGRREIISAVEEMGFVLDASVCLEAQNALININKRLNAELTWFIDVDTKTLSQINECITNESPIPTDSLESLSRFNATLYNFELLKPSDSYEIGYGILEIDELYSSLNSVNITEKINQNRSAGKLAIVQEQDVRNELNKIRDIIRQVIAEKLSAFSDNKYFELITIISQKCIADSEYDNGVILSDVIDQYEVKVQSSLESAADTINNHIEQIKNAANEDINEKVDVLIKRINKWNVIAKPLQILAQSTGMPHEMSEDMAQKLRQLAVFLHNERKETDVALKLVKAMKKEFSALENIKELFEEDEKTLTSILQNNKNVKDILDELEILKKTSEQLKSYPTSNGIDLFVQRIKTVNKKIIQSNVLDEEAKTQLRESLCYMARATAIELHNEKHQTQFALTIAQALLYSFGNMSSLTVQLTDDYARLKQQQQALHLSHSVSNNTSTKSDSNGCLKAFVIFVAVGIIVLIIAALISSSSGSSSSSKSSYSQSSSSASTAVSSYTITLNKNGGAGGTSSVTVSYGKSMPTATAPTKIGYTFKGYYSSMNGYGTQYYNEYMNSVHTWDKSYDGTLYAYWIESDDSITLTPDNFEDYFDLTTSAKFVDDVVTVTYSISLKDSAYKKGEKASNTIRVDIGVDISLLQYTYGEPTYDKKQTITLTKANNYSATGEISLTYTTYATTIYWSADVVAVSGILDK